MNKKRNIYDENEKDVPRPMDKNQHGREGGESL